MAWKPNLEAFDHRNDLVFVIDRFNYIEYLLDEILTIYLKPHPDRADFVRRWLLNTSIVSFGSKIKLFGHINATEGWAGPKLNTLHRLAHIRNQFAHSGETEFSAVVPSDPDAEPHQTTATLILASVAGSGKFERVDASVALHEFTQLWVEAKDALHAILSELRNEPNT